MKKLSIVVNVGALLAAAGVAGNLVEIKSQKLIYNATALSAEGKILAIYDDYYLQASKLTLKENKLIGEGKVLLYSADKSVYIKAKRVVYDLKTKTIKIFGAAGRVKGKYFEAKEVEIKGNLYTFRKFCGSKCSDFQAEICSKKFVYNSTSGKGELKNAVLKVENIPVFYTPYFAFLTKRKTGLLPPRLGVDYYGNFFYRQPFYWAIDRTSDATFTFDYRADKLYGLETEFRKYFAKDFYVETTQAYYYDNAEGEYWWVGRDYYRKNRYLLSGEGYKGNFQFGWEFPSDKDFYYDVYFFEDELHYKSFAKSYINYSINERDFLLNFAARYFYNLESENRTDDLVSAPDLLLYLKPQRVAENAYFDFTGSLNGYYIHEKGFLRFYLEPRLRYSTVLGTTPVAFYLKPYYLRYTTDDYDNYRNVYGVEFSAKGLLNSFDLVRTERWNLLSLWEGVYTFQPFEQRPTPNFDYFDLNSKANMFTLRGINELRYKGKRVAQLIAEQSYNFYNGYNFPTDGEWIGGHWLPLKLTYRVNTPSKRVSLSGKLYYDHYMEKVVYHTESLNLSLIKTVLGELTVNLSYVKSVDSEGEKSSNQYSYGVKFKYRRWNLKFKNRYDRMISKNVKTTISAGYVKECWALALNYSREYDRDSEKYHWSAYLTFTVFGRGVNFFLGGGEQ